MFSAATSGILPPSQPFTVRVETPRSSPSSLPSTPIVGYSAPIRVGLECSPSESGPRSSRWWQTS